MFLSINFISWVVILIGYRWWDRLIRCFWLHWRCIGNNRSWYWIRIRFIWYLFEGDVSCLLFFTMFLLSILRLLDWFLLAYRRGCYKRWILVSLCVLLMLLSHFFYVITPITSTTLPSQVLFLLEHTSQLVDSWMHFRILWIGQLMR